MSDLSAADVKLLDCATSGDLEGVRCALEKGADAFHNAKRALWSAAGSGFLEVVRELIPVSDVSYDHSRALTKAAMAGHLDVVRELLPVSRLVDPEQSALAMAVKAGHLDVVREILSAYDSLELDHVEKQVVDNMKLVALRSRAIHLDSMDMVKLLVSSMDGVDLMSAVMEAAWHSGIECLEYLFDRVPKDNNFTATMYYAVVGGRMENVNFLLPYVDEKEVRKLLDESGLGKSAVLLDSAVQLRDLKLKHLSGGASVRHRKEGL